MGKPYSFARTKAVFNSFCHQFLLLVDNKISPLNLIAWDLQQRVTMYFGMESEIEMEKSPAPFGSLRQESELQWS